MRGNSTDELLNEANERLDDAQERITELEATVASLECGIELINRERDRLAQQVYDLQRIIER